MHSPLQLNCCAENFPNNGDDFGFATDEVPQGDKETKGYSFWLNERCMTFFSSDSEK